MVHGRLPKRARTRPLSLWGSHTALTDAAKLDGIRGDEPVPKTRKTPIKRDFALAAGTGRDPGLRVRIPLGLPKEPRYGAVFHLLDRVLTAASNRL